LLLAQHRADEAWPALDRAVQLAPDDFDILYGAAVAALVHLDRASDRTRGDLEQRAFAALTRAAVLAPTSPDTFAWLAYAGLRQREWDAAANAIARAIALAPGRTEFRIRQADIMILRGAPNAARPMLQEIAARSPDRVSADSARRRLEALDAAATPGSAAANTVAARGPLAGPPRQGSPMRLDLRRVQAGEEQAFGRLTAVECRVGQVRFHVEAGGHDVVTAAAQFADVDLVRFTDSKESKLGCGARVAPDPVYVTWRVSKPSDWPADISGVTVALEFLPPDYTPQ
ncbi:MAG: tetratricopeptide repeat protein, partial [Vicinamibacterales bacterium]